MSNRSFSHVLVIGLALFSIMFGAGNLLFPPELGAQLGSRWPLGFFCFSLMDVGLAVLCLFAMLRRGGAMEDLTGHLGTGVARVLDIAAVVTVGPLLVVPRTAATVCEMSVAPFFPNLGNWVPSFIFFALVYFLTVQASGVVDVVGKLLTPVLLLALLVLIISGLRTASGELLPGAPVSAAVHTGIRAGYQTMDMLMVLILVSVLLAAMSDRGVVEKGRQKRILAGASLVAGGSLMLVYGGLAYLGADRARLMTAGMTPAAFLVQVTRDVLGKSGVLILACIAALACLTTAIGLTSACCLYFSRLHQRSPQYETWVLCMCVFSFFISNLGLASILKLAVPLLELLFPIFIVQALLSFFPDRPESPALCRGGAAGALLGSVFLLLAPKAAAVLPLSGFGLGWILPALLGILVGYLLSCRRPGRDLPQ